jgi:PAS domain S-box-containing protein
MYRVLYVDDECGLLEIAQVFLEMSGDLKVDTALSAHEAEGRMEEERYDAIISDYQMPEMNGIELLKRVRDAYKDLPFILFTGKGREEVVIEALNNGVTFYVQKGGDPISQFKELEHKVKNAIVGHKTEMALKKSEARFRSLIENAPVAIAILQDGVITYANPLHREIFGYTRPEEYTGLSLCDFITSPDRGMKAWRPPQGMERGSLPFEVEFLGWRRDGTQFPIQVTAAQVTISDAPAVLTFITDITERKKTDEELRGTMGQLSMAIDMAGLASWEFDPMTGTFLFNDRFYKLYSTDAGREGGYRMAAKDYVETFVPPEEVPRLVEVMSAVSQPEYGQDFLQIEHSIIRRDGEKRHIIVRSISVKDENGKRSMGFGVTQDITEIKRAEERLRSTMGQLSMALDMATLASWELDLDTSTFTFNDQFYRIYATDAQREGGYQMSSIEYFHRFVYPEDYDLVRVNSRNSMLSTPPIGYFQFEHRILRRDGEVRRILVRSANWQSEDGKHRRIFGINQDITEMRNAEEEVRRSRQKLDLLSDLTHHDIKNQILIQTSTLELMRSTITDPEQLKRIGRLERSVNIVQEQMDFTSVYQRMGTALPQWQPIEEIVRCVQEQRPAKALFIGKGIAGLQVLADPMLIRVFHNLVEDSLLYGGGPMTITVDCMERDGGLVLSYEDDGVGIPHEEKQELFTKGFGKGTGLGLFLSKEILAITGIIIRETGEPGRGVRFEMFVPEGKFKYVNGPGTLSKLGQEEPSKVW